MSPETVLRSDPLDILFGHRNKAYSAYTLRKEYYQRLSIAQGSTPLPPAATHEKPVTIKVTAPVIERDNVVDHPPPLVEMIEKEDALNRTGTEDGPKPTGIVPTSPGVPGGTGTAPVTPAPVSEPPPSVFEVMEIMPKFPGGGEALIRSQRKKLRIPEERLEAGEKMKVALRFVVGSGGTITDLSFPNPSDEAYRSEIRGVMKKMPK